jgi:hypothetical protein
MTVRILLDNCVPWRLGTDILKFAQNRGQDCSVASVVKLGWADLDDGPLLDAMTGKFDVLLTMDKSMQYQQRIDTRAITIVVLRAKTNRLADLQGAVTAILTAIEARTVGTVVEVAC